MSFFQTTSLYKLFYPILILSFFLISTCTNDNSITANNNETSLSKPIDISDITSTNPIFPPALIALIEEHIGFFSTAEVRCLGEWIESTGSQTNIQSAYDFRDNYLLNSEKGQLYTASYYFLSEYGIDNNLVMKHSLEHLSLMNLGIEVSRELQHGTNDNKILINKSTYDDCKNIVKIYRESDNHTEVDFVLDYLETDLEKYYNKPKAEIATDFQ